MFCRSSPYGLHISQEQAGSVAIETSQGVRPDLVSSPLNLVTSCVLDVVGSGSKSIQFCLVCNDHTVNKMMSIQDASALENLAVENLMLRFSAF